MDLMMSKNEGRGEPESRNEKTPASFRRPGFLSVVANAVYTEPPARVVSVPLRFSCPIIGATHAGTTTASGRWQVIAMAWMVNMEVSSPDAGRGPR